MYGHINSKSGKAAAIIIGFMMFLTMLLSSLYISCESGHECHGQGCPVCEHIHQCEYVLNQISSGLTDLAIAVIAFAFVLLSVSVFTYYFSCTTPVSTKVRMNN